MRRARERELVRERKRQRRIGKRVATGAGATLGATVLFAPAADAATFTVSNLNDSGGGSLRDAIGQANATPGLDDVNFSGGLTGTITLASGEILISDDLRVNGPGAGVLTVNGSNADRIFDVNTTDGAPFEPVLISGLTLTGGNATGRAGGAVFLEDASLTLQNMVVTGNVADYDGGGVASRYGTSTTPAFGSFTASGSTFANNRALGVSNNYSGDGGAIFLDGNAEPVLIRDTSVSGNTAGDEGGGIMFYDLYGSGTIERTTISGNSSLGSVATQNSGGGGLALYDQHGTFKLSESTVAGNTAALQGGGVWFYDTVGPTTIQNTTISGNSATTEGGGIWLYDIQGPTAPTGGGPGGAVTLANSTVAGNTAGTAGGGVYFTDTTGDPQPPDTPVVIQSSIVADNTSPASDLSQNPAGTAGFTIGFSLIENPGSVPSTSSGPNIVGQDPQLGPLANNGGPTQTRAISKSSPAFDKGLSAGLTIDQRGLARPVNFNTANAAGGDGADIGAFEVQKCQGKPVTIQAIPDGVTKGTNKKDVILGSAAKETIKSSGGNDLVCAGGGKDKVNAGKGKDKVQGQDGNDKLKGGTGNDKLIGGKGKDKLFGQKGNDKLKGGKGKDKLVGGPGRDKLNGGPGKDKEIQ